MPPALAIADIPPLATVTLPDQQICKVGRWNGRPYTPDDFEQLVRNYQELGEAWGIPLTRGHDGEEAVFTDREPALGWASNLRFDGETLWGDYHRVPVKVAQFVKSGAFPKKSCTFLEDPEIDGQVRRGLVLQNIALLGAHQPAVDGLADLESLYNRRRLSATGGKRLTIEDTDRRRTVNLPLLLARLTPDARAGYDAWKAAHPTTYQLISGPPMSDIQSAVEKALAQSYPPAEGDSDDGAPGADGPSQNVLDWFVSGQEMSVIVSDQDVDNLWEIPFTYDSSSDTASLSSPIPVKGTYTQNTSGQESGGGGTDDAGAGDGTGDAGAAGGGDGGAGSGQDGGAGGATQMARILGHYAAVQSLSRKHELDPDVEALVEPVTAAVMRLAAAPVDTAVEDLVTEMSGDLDTWLGKLNSIATGKAGVTQMRTLLGMLKTGLGKFKVTPPADKGGAGGGGDGSPPPKSAPPTKPAAQNARALEEPEMVRLSQLTRELGLPADASEDDILRAVQGAAAARGVVTTLARKVDQLLERDAEKETTTMLDQAVAEGRLKRWSKPGQDSEMYTNLRRLAKSDLATARSIVQSLPKFVDTTEYGVRGGSGEPPAAFQISPFARMNGASEEGVRRELRKLGRDLDSISTETLAERWKRERHEAQLARAKKNGIPVRA